MDGVTWREHADEQGLPPADTALFAAVEANDVATVKARLDAGVDPNQPRGNEDGRTPLILAIEQGYYDCMRLLLDGGANAHFYEEGYRSPLRVALHKQDAAAVKILLEYGADPFYDAATKRADGTEYNVCMTDLQVAAEGDPAIAQMVKDASHKFEICHLLKKTKAAEPNDIPAITALLDKGCPVDAQNYDGRTALMYACGDKDGALIQLLLDRGANPNITMNDGMTTALYFACVGSHPPPDAGIVKMLLDRGADPYKLGKNGRTLMHSVAHGKNEEVLKLLVEKGVSPLVRDDRGYTPAEAVIADQMGTAEEIAPLMDRVNAWHENVIDTIAQDAVKLGAPIQSMKKLRFAPRTA